MAVKSHMVWLVIGNSRTTVAVVVEGDDIAFVQAFIVWGDKLLVSVVAFTGRHKRQIPIGECSHIVLIAFFQLEKVGQSEFCPLVGVHSWPPFSKR